MTLHQDLPQLVLGKKTAASRRRNGGALKGALAVRAKNDNRASARVIGALDARGRRTGGQTRGGASRNVVGPVGLRPLAVATEGVAFARVIDGVKDRVAIGALDARELAVHGATRLASRNSRGAVLARVLLVRFVRLVVRRRLGVGGQSANNHHGHEGQDQNAARHVFGGTEVKERARIMV